LTTITKVQSWIQMTPLHRITSQEIEVYNISNLFYAKKILVKWLGRDTKAYTPILSVWVVLMNECLICGKTLCKFDWQISSS